MTYDQLWAPWRSAYIESAKESGDADKGACFFCRYREESRDTENLVVSRSERTFVVMNRYPYNNGHLLIAPLAHKARLDELDDGELLECMQQLRTFVALYECLLQPHGFNIGANLGRPAGAGVPGHLHWHLVPRWSGDTNFMTVVDDVRVISQSLETLYGYLRAELSKQKY